MARVCSGVTSVGAQRLRSTGPWARSTGPKTTEGKAKVARNAYSGATRPLLRGLARALRQQRHSLR